MTLTDKLESLSRAMERNRDVLDSGSFFTRKLAELSVQADYESRQCERRIARFNLKQGV